MRTEPRWAVAALLFTAIFVCLPDKAQAQFVCQDVASGTADGATATGANAVACGTNASASGAVSTAVGWSANASGIQSSAYGAAATASGNNSSAFGLSSNASGLQSSAFGAASTASGTLSSAFGTSSTASGIQSSAYGASSSASGDNSSAYGLSSTASGLQSSAYGAGSVASGSAATAIGNAAQAGFANSTAIGSGATATAANQMMFGTAANTYATPGITSAASQAAQGAPTHIVTSNANGDLAAYTFSQLGLAGSSELALINQRINDLDGRTTKALQGVAMAFAMAGMPTLLPNERFVVTGNWGTYEGQNGLAVGAAFRLTSNIQANGGVAYGLNGSNVGGRLGLRVGW